MTNLRAKFRQRQREDLRNATTGDPERDVLQPRPLAGALDDVPDDILRNAIATNLNFWGIGIAASFAKRPVPRFNRICVRPLHGGPEAADANRSPTISHSQPAP